MAQTYQQLQKQITELQAKAEKAKRSEMKGVVSTIRAAIATYGLTAQNLFSANAQKAKPTEVKTAKSSPQAAAKYSDGKGNTWGGMGKRPYWLRDALGAGASLEDFAGVSAAAPVVAEKGASAKAKANSNAKPAKTGAAAKKVPVAKYQDGAGNALSGRGPQPKWLKNAIAGGKTLEELAAS